MARIAGVILNESKRIEVGLTAIFGVGLKTAQKILAQTNIDPNIRVKDLTEEQIDRLRSFIEKSIKVEGDLRLEVAQNIKRLREINSYRGSRHAQRLPARGQRTKTNARTKRGHKITVGSGRKKTADKT